MGLGVSVDSRMSFSGAVAAGVSRRFRRAAFALSRRPATCRTLCSKGEAAAEGGSAGKGGPLNWYLRQLDENPLVTKSLTSMVIVGAGDVLCQGVLEVRSCDPKPEHGRWRRQREREKRR